jgi:CRISPR/Cas system CMR subunit Cmr4 (Cas7 group RAMP superfamily)
MAVEPIITIARFVVEAEAPLMIAGGEDDPLYDNSLARDANGLPMVPATGIAGLLRAGIDEATAKIWFGHQTGLEGARSRIVVTDGLFHWSDDRLCDGLALGDLRRKLEADPLCREVLAAAPVLRDHVRLNARGVVDGEGKFNRAAVPAGARFTFELRGHDREAVEALHAKVKAGLWIGGATRSGYGRLICRCAGLETVRRDTAEGWRRYLLFAAADLGSSPLALETVPSPNISECWGIVGRIEGPLLVGGPPREGMKENRAPYREKVINWTGTSACIGWRHVLPGSAIKGPLRHRVQFHLRRLGHAPNEAEAVVNGLFGNASNKGGGRAGKLRFRDAALPEPALFALTHVGIDRFTGGARDSALFTDAMLWRPEIRIDIEEVATLTGSESEAFSLALYDMAHGLCAIGAEWGDGAGIFDPSTRVIRPEGRQHAA